VDIEIEMGWVVLPDGTCINIDHVVAVRVEASQVPGQFRVRIDTVSGLHFIVGGSGSELDAYGKLQDVSMRIRQASRA